MVGIRLARVLQITRRYSVVPGSAFVEQVAGQLVWLTVRLDSTVVSVKVYVAEDGTSNTQSQCAVKDLVFDFPGQFSTMEMRHLKIDGGEHSNIVACCSCTVTSDAPAAVDRWFGWGAVG